MLHVARDAGNAAPLMALSCCCWWWWWRWWWWWCCLLSVVGIVYRCSRDAEYHALCRQQLGKHGLCLESGSPGHRTRSHQPDSLLAYSVSPASESHPNPINAFSPEKDLPYIKYWFIMHDRPTATALRNGTLDLNLRHRWIKQAPCFFLPIVEWLWVNARDHKLMPDLSILWHLQEFARSLSGQFLDVVHIVCSRMTTSCSAVSWLV